MIDTTKIESAFAEVLLAIRENPRREGLKGTPARIGRMYAEIFSGLNEDPGEHLCVSFDEDQHKEMVIIKDIPFFSMCEHHFLPFVGKAHIGYIPDKGRIAGLSKFARVVESVSRRPQLQERLTSQIADTLVQRLEPRGAIVIVSAEHLCMTMRGIRKPGSFTVTSAVRGLFRENQSTRQEALALIHAP